MNAEPTSPTTANVTVTPPPNGPWARYNVTLCPVAGPASECVTRVCFTPSNCPVTGLDPGTAYVTTVSIAVCLAAALLLGWVTTFRTILVHFHVPTWYTQVVAIKSGGQTSPPSNEDIFTTPDNVPVLTSAEAWGPTTGQATATPPVGVTFTTVSCHVQPASQ